MRDQRIVRIIWDIELFGGKKCMKSFGLFKMNGHKVEVMNIIKKVTKVGVIGRRWCRERQLCLRGMVSPRRYLKRN